MGQHPANATGLQWMVRGNTFQVCGRTMPRLPAGAYSVALDNCNNAHFTTRNLQSDDVIDFPDSLAARVLEEIDRFWKKGDRFRKHGFLHRRGYLFYGKQGCGKSSLVHLIISRIIGAGQLAFFCEYPYAFFRAMEQLREVEPERPIVCVFEDVDAIIAAYGDSELLQWLDGNHQVDKAINLATTNYPEKLDRRIISRPRRFDRILRIDAPDARMREAYFGRKLPELEPAELSRWVELSEGLPFAALAELIISVCCLDNDLEKSATHLRELDAHNPSSNEFADGSAENPQPAPVPALGGDGSIPF
jgi:SpoVK/Ycf46/Vps4 family AAA+-type ATPase